MVLSLHADGREPLEDPQIDTVEAVFISRHRRAQSNRASPTSPRVPVYRIAPATRPADPAWSDADVRVRQAVLDNEEDMESTPAQMPQLWKDWALCQRLP